VFSAGRGEQEHSSTPARITAIIGHQEANVLIEELQMASLWEGMKSLNNESLAQIDLYWYR
jgi:hypothetical protein